MATYRDLNLQFLSHPITGDLVMKNDVDSILQSIKSLIQTGAGEILWEPNIGGGIARIMFEQNDAMLQIQLHDKIMTTIGMFEPRVEIVNLNINRFENGQGVYITLEFYYLNSSETILETIAVKRIR